MLLFFILSYEKRIFSIFCDRPIHVFVSEAEKTVHTNYMSFASIIVHELHLSSTTYKGIRDIINFYILFISCFVLTQKCTL